MLDFTEHPILKPPTDEEIVLLGEADPKLLEELHRAHEGRIRAATDDPIRYGFDLPGWERMSDSFREYNTEIMTIHIFKKNDDFGIMESCFFLLTYFQAMHTE